MRRLLGLCVAGLTAVGAAAVTAQPVDPAYTLAGKTVRVIVAGAVGGTTDLQARFLASHLGSHLPGNPEIVVQNVTGGGGLRMIEFVNQLDAGTELFIYSIPSSMPFEARSAPGGYAFDPRTAQWIGSFAGSGGVCVMSAASGVRALADLGSRPFKMGATEVTSNTYAQYMMLNYAFGFALDPIVGYDSLATITLALTRGEIDGHCTSYSSYQTTLRPLVAAGTVVPILTLGLYPLPDVGAPWLFDQPMDADRRTLLEAAMSATYFNRPFVAGANADPAFVAVMREAFAAAVADPAFVAAAGALDLEVHYDTPQRIAERIAELYARPDTVIAEIRALLFTE